MNMEAPPFSFVQWALTQQVFVLFNKYSFETQALNHSTFLGYENETNKFKLQPSKKLHSND